MGDMPAPGPELPIADDLVPLRRPQLRLEGESVFFFGLPAATHEPRRRRCDVMERNGRTPKRRRSSAADFDDARERLSAMGGHKLIELSGRGISGRPCPDT